MHGHILTKLVQITYYHIHYKHRVSEKNWTLCYFIISALAAMNCMKISRST